jgi:hypothetical protein
MSEGEKYSRKLNATDIPKQVAAQLLRRHHSAAQGPRDFNRGCASLLSKSWSARLAGLPE